MKLSKEDALELKVALEDNQELIGMVISHRRIT